MGRKGKYEEWITDDGLKVIKGWARDGYTDADIYKRIGVSEHQFYEWLKRFPQIAQALKKGRAPILVDVEDTLIEKKLNGYFVDEEVTEVTQHPDGTTTKHKRVYKRWIAPDTTAIIFFLKTRKGAQYSERMSIAMENSEMDGKIERLIEAVKDVK